MPNTTAPSRAAPSFPHHNYDNARHPHSVMPTSSVTSSGATTNEWDMLRCLLNASVKRTGEAGRHISQRLHAFKLVNYSPLAAEMRIERIDHAVVLVGEQWLSTLTFAHALAQHLRNGRADKESDEAVLQVMCVCQLLGVPQCVELTVNTAFGNEANATASLVRHVNS